MTRYIVENALNYDSTKTEEENANDEEENDILKSEVADLLDKILEFRSSADEVILTEEQKELIVDVDLDEIYPEFFPVSANGKFFNYDDKRKHTICYINNS